MLTTRFVPHAMLINSAAGTDQWVNQVESMSADQNSSLFEKSSGSQIAREYVAIKLNSPTIDLSTSDLSLVSVIGMTGVQVSAGASTPGVVIYARETPNESVPASISTAAHITVAISDGMIVPVSISASNNDYAKFALRVHAILGSGGNSGATPMVMTALQTIPTGAGATVNIYTTGVVKYTISGGSSRLCYGIMEQSVDFGLGVVTKSDSGEPYPTNVSIMSQNPHMSFTTEDEELVTEIGQGQSVSSFAMYFRAIAQNGLRVANATTSHISVIGTAGMVVPKKTGMTHGKAANGSFEFSPTLNTNLLTISTSTAIPAS